jgi:acetoin:2,6-dichlorophenolindophenol oxidoreductase subunit beta
MKNKKINFSTAIKQAMFDSMKLDKKVIIYGLGVGTSGNIYGTTKGLKEKFGKNRVFDAPASESALTAMGTGMALAGTRPILIHQRFDFMIYSLDQIVNWISLWSYKSAGKSQIPITIRAVVGKGWGQGPQHSKTLHSWFANLPGISVVYPSSPYEAKGLLLGSIFSNFPTIFFESRSLHASEEEVPEKPYFLDPTKSFIRKTGKDLTIVGFGPSIINALEVSQKLERIKKISCEIVDLRSINPIDEETILQSVKKTKNLCVIEHGWPNSSVSSDIISKVSSKVHLKSKPVQICWPNSHIPTAHDLEKKFYFNSEDIIKKILKNFK